MFIIDAHLDLSMNAMEWNRDLCISSDEINLRERGLKDKPGRGNATVSITDLRKGNIGLVVATQIARYVSPENKLDGWHSQEQAWAQTQGQLAWYKAMEEKGEMTMITDLQKLNDHIKLWESDVKGVKPIGYILSLEGADSLINMDHLHKAYDYGLRAIGPAHYGPGRYANGTDANGGLTDAGKELLNEMAKLNMILDATHLCDDAFWDAMEIYDGPVWASHNNVRSIVNHNRQFSDDQIKILIEKGAVIGAAFDAWMIVPGWERGKSDPKQMNCNLEALIRHIDHICQIAGNTAHVGIGSDLDGGFGKEQCPFDITTIADLQKLPELLYKYGYTETNVEQMMHGNWLRFLRKAWE